jgi:hypothetical protein
MANTFLRFTEKEIGNTLTQIDSYTVTGTDKIATVIGLSVSNRSSASVDIDATLNDGTSDFYIIKSCPLPSGSTIQLAGGGQKIVLEENDKIKVKSSSATDKVDVIMSLLEIT